MHEFFKNGPDIQYTQKYRSFQIEKHNFRVRGQMAFFRENFQTHVAPTKFYDN